MYIKSVNIEGMNNVTEKTYTFNKLNYLYGSNGAGKSTVLQAIQFALLGYIPGEAKKNDSLFKHARKNTLSVTCVLDDAGKDVKVTRSVVGGKTVTKTFSTDPEGYDLEGKIKELELPVFNFSEFLGLTANQMKDWFISFLPKSGQSIEWGTELQKAAEDVKIIDTSLLPDCEKVFSEFTGDPVSQVLQANSYIKERISLLKRDTVRIQSTIQSLVCYDDAEVTMSSQDAQAEIDNMNSILTRLMHAEEIKSQNAAIQGQLAELPATSGTCPQDDTTIQSLTQKIQDMKQNELAEISNKLQLLRETELDARTKLQAAQHERDTAQRIIAASIQELTTRITAGDGTCPYTNCVCESAAKFIDQVESQLEEKKTAYEAGKSPTEIEVKLQKTAKDMQERILEAEKEILELNKQISLMSADINRMLSIYDKRAELTSRLQMEPIAVNEDGEWTIDSCKERIHDLAQIASKAGANEKYNQLIEQITADKYQTENSIEVLKLWDKLTSSNGLQTILMEAPFKELESDMSECLHLMFDTSDVSAKFLLSGKSNSFSFGLVRDDKYLTYSMLSSGEKCMYTLALMTCLINRSASELKLVLVDDLLDHLDDTNAAALFESLTRVTDTQLILAGVKECNLIDSDVVIEVK